MTGTRRRCVLAGLALPLAAALLAGCAQPPRSAPPGPGVWSGRLALQIASEPPQSFAAGFELRGRADEGELLLTSPLGNTLALMSWSADSARLRQGTEERRYESLDALASEITGAPIPVRALFDWLEGHATVADGWQADLTRLAEGRLLARRAEPAPAAELRLLLER
ncbi:lipoprotein insertase outer membrane protein LolB [Ramlibacter sp. 2FC]|uniref:lipoprotein insertase outer membrane protein LolB n=1 Tax=Ramlibacter sp. 2FC TaxID=2502188 RepID=UPI0010F9EA46|nr:lipoprotein insertase outer membrane protein LolB [Ramlibacter sp. 2FC]